MKRSVAGKRGSKESRPIHKFRLPACLPVSLLICQHHSHSHSHSLSHSHLARTPQGRAQVTCSSQPIAAHLVWPLFSCSFRLLQLTGPRLLSVGTIMVFNLFSECATQPVRREAPWVQLTRKPARCSLSLPAAAAVSLECDAGLKASHFLESNICFPLHHHRHATCLPCRYLSNSSLSSAYHISKMYRLMPPPPTPCSWIVISCIIYLLLSSPKNTHRKLAHHRLHPEGRVLTLSFINQGC